MDERFINNLIRMQQEAFANSEAAAGASAVQREWSRPADLLTGGGVVYDPTKIDEVVAGFSRAQIGVNYATVLAGGLPMGAGMSLKLQSDYLAAKERSAHLRHASPIRCRIHSATRRSAHANQMGVIARVYNYAQDLFMAGG